MKDSKITQESLKRHLHYCPETGVFVWIGRAHGRKIGSVAGSLQNHGYVLISICGERHGAHRLAWLYVHGEWPNSYIDHVNRIPSDNRIENLREATPSQNMMNRCPAQKTSGGVKGVHWEKQRKKWRAYIYVNRKRVHIGRFDTLQEAKTAREKAAIGYHGEYVFSHHPV